MEERLIDKSSINIYNKIMEKIRKLRLSTILRTVCSVYASIPLLFIVLATIFSILEKDLSFFWACLVLLIIFSGITWFSYWAIWTKGIFRKIVCGTIITFLYFCFWLLTME